MRCARWCALSMRVRCGAVRCGTMQSGAMGREWNRVCDKFKEAGR